MTDGTRGEGEHPKRSWVIRTVTVTAGAAIVAAAAILILVFGLNAEISWF